VGVWTTLHGERLIEGKKCIPGCLGKKKGVSGGEKGRKAAAQLERDDMGSTKTADRGAQKVKGKEVKYWVLTGKRGLRRKKEGKRVSFTEGGGLQKARKHIFKRLLEGKKKGISTTRTLNSGGNKTGSDHCNIVWGKLFLEMGGGEKGERLWGKKKMAAEQKQHSPKCHSWGKAD